MAVIRQNYNFLVIATGAIGTIIAIGTIVAIGTPNDPIILSGDGEKDYAAMGSYSFNLRPHTLVHLADRTVHSAGVAKTQRITESLAEHQRHAHVLASAAAGK
ncbi:hypothetical protein ACHWQZ_G010381 [Mnemiopsis leidyi]